MPIYRSERAISIPSNLNLTQLLRSSARSTAAAGDQLIAQDDLEGRSLTISQLRNNAGRLARGLTTAFRPPSQSRWAILLPNSIVYIEACHAVLWMGDIFCPINHLLTVHEIANALAICKPSFIIAYTEVAEKVVQAINIAIRTKPALQRPALLTAAGPRGEDRQLQDYVADSPLDIPHYSDTREILASIHLSSGTTGTSKGVCLSHFNYVANVLQMWAHDPDHWSPAEQIVCFTPFVHIANTTIPLFLGPWSGMRHIIMAKYDQDACCRLVQEKKATAMQLTPATAVAIATTDLSARYDLSSIKHMVVGGLPLTKDLLTRFFAKGIWKTVQLYGMTEAAPYVAWQKVDETIERGQIGKLLPGIEARLCDESGTDVPAGSAGEMWIRGPNVTNGYVDNPDATRLAFKEHGWYNTGDVCTFSPRGYLSIVGRTKELIKYNGFQVAPVELETYLNGHPAIADAAIGAVTDKTRMTELPTAYVVLKANIGNEEDKIAALRDIQQHVDSKVSGYKKLRGGVWEVKELPRTSTGKFMRTQLSTHATGLNSKQKLGRSKL